MSKFHDQELEEMDRSSTHKSPSSQQDQFIDEEEEDVELLRRKRKRFQPRTLLNICSVVGAICVVVLFCVISFLVIRYTASSKIYLFEPDEAMLTPNIKFIVVGDWGRLGEYNQRECGQQMGHWCLTHGGCQFIVSTGDNFYENGVTSIYDSNWKLSFEDIYSVDGLNRTKWYPVLGNHDYRQNINAQFEYSSVDTQEDPEFRQRWDFPSPYYTKIIQQDSLKLKFIFLDSTPLIQKYYTDGKTNVTALQSQNVEAQKEFVVQELQASSQQNIDFQFIVCHHGLRSAAGKHGDTSELLFWEPIFEQHGVKAGFYGHDHSLIYMKKENGTMAHLLSGAGSETRNDIDINYEGLKAAYTSTGFMFVTVDKTKIKVQFVNYQGMERSRFFIRR